MEKWQREYITSCMDALVENTRYNTSLGTKLLSKDIMSESEVSLLDTIQHEDEKSRQLYKTLMTKTGAYDVFMEILCEAKQSGAANILQEGFAKCRERRSSEPKLSSPERTDIPKSVIRIEKKQCIEDYIKKVEKFIKSDIQVLSEKQQLNERQSQFCREAEAFLEQQLEQLSKTDLIKLKAEVTAELKNQFRHIKQTFQGLKATMDKSLLIYEKLMGDFTYTCKSKEQLKHFHASSSQKEISAFRVNIEDFGIPTEEYAELLQTYLDDVFNKQEKILEQKLRGSSKPEKQLLDHVLKTYNEEMESQFNNNLHFQQNQLVEAHENACQLAIRRCANKHSQAQKSELLEVLHKYLAVYENKNDMSVAQHDPAIGIDLGTVNCCVAVYQNGKVETIQNEAGHNSTPSYVAYNQQGEVASVGDLARQNAWGDPENVIYDSKRLIGRSMNETEVKNDQKSWQFALIDDNNVPTYKLQNKYYFCPEDVSAELLKECRRQAELRLGCPIKKAVITVPAYFTDDQRKATLKAGSIAGLEVLKIINEPTAAGIAFGWNLICDPPKTVLIFDLGGGTFDVAVITLGNQKIKVNAFDGDTHLGGVDMDRHMMNYCANKFKISTGIDIFDRAKPSSSTKQQMLAARKGIQRLHDACETCKRQLTCRPLQTVSVTDIADGKHLNVPVSRELLDSLCEPLYDRMIKIIERVLRKAKIKKHDVDEVIMVGGVSRDPTIRKRVREFFDQKALNFGINPAEAVAYGAAIEAAILNGERFKGMLVQIEDVVPMSIGIECIQKNQVGRFFAIIESNSKYPIQAEDVFYTSRDDQEWGNVRVYQGENKMASDNHYIGNYIFKGIPKGKKGTQSIKVILKINANGTLEVEVECEATRKKDGKQLGGLPFIGSRRRLDVTRTKSRDPQIPE